MGANMHGAVSLADDRTYLFIVREGNNTICKNAR